jgi:ankyrin repeat protein
MNRLHRVLLTVIFLFGGIASANDKSLEKFAFEKSPYIEAAQAIRKNNVKKLKKLIATENFDVNFESQKVQTSYHQKDTMTLLNWAVLWDSYDCAAALLEAGADPNKSNSSGITPLIMTSYSKKGDKLFDLLLVQYKADPNKVRTAGVNKSALSFVLQQERLEEKRFKRAEQLLQHGANIDLDLDEGQTALISLGKLDFYREALWLLEHGANYEVCNYLNNTMMDYLRDSYDMNLDSKTISQRDKVRDWLIAHGVDRSRVDPAIESNSKEKQIPL